MAKKTVKQIEMPEFTSATKLTPLQMNKLKCSPKHTVLTPELLDRMAAQEQNQTQTQSDSTPVTSR